MLKVVVIGVVMNLFVVVIMVIRLLVLWCFCISFSVLVFSIGVIILVMKCLCVVSVLFSGWVCYMVVVKLMYLFRFSWLVW